MRLIPIIGLFLLGLVILFFPYFVQERTKRVHFNEVTEIKKIFKEMSKEEKERELTTIERCNEAIFHNEEGLHDPFTFGYDRSHFEGCQDAPEVGETIGALEIPKLNLHVPMFVGTRESELLKGVGQVDGSSLPYGGLNTHTVLAGHRGMWTSKMFRHLDEMTEGDIFVLHTLSGELTYEVYQVDVVRPFETESLTIIEGEDLASLITCHPYGYNSHRLIVYGKRIN